MPFNVPKLSASERLALLIVAFVLLLVGGFYLFRPQWSVVSFTTSYQGDTLSFPFGNKAKRLFNPSTNRLATPSAESYTLFPFDPNQADSLELRRLGLMPFQVRNILKYRAKGGIFRTRASFAKLYGLSDQKYRELQPYLKLPDSIRQVFPPRTPSVKESYLYPLKLQRGETLELNAADTTHLKRLPGIGSGYARMIVAYRRRLGGFVSAEQLREVERLPDSVVRSVLPYLTLVVDSIVRINLNIASIERMQAHPYLNFYQAKAIVEHRRRHGHLRSLGQLRLYDEFTAIDLDRLSPYIQF